MGPDWLNSVPKNFPELVLGGFQPHKLYKGSFRIRDDVIKKVVLLVVVLASDISKKEAG